MDKIEPFQCSKGRDIKQRHVKNISKTSFVELKENINLFLHDIYIYPLWLSYFHYIFPID